MLHIFICIYVNKYIPEYDEYTYIIELSTKQRKESSPYVTPFYYWKEDYLDELERENDIER